ncbi:hypothetical protein TorRG33x02_317030, partial [Trema orientale]
MIGGGQYRPEGLPEDGGGGAGLPDVVENPPEIVAGPVNGVLDRGVERVGGLVVGGGEEGVGGDEGGDEGGGGDCEKGISQESGGRRGRRREGGWAESVVENGRRRWDVLGILEIVWGLGWGFGRGGGGREEARSVVKMVVVLGIQVATRSSETETKH